MPIRIERRDESGFDVLVLGASNCIEPLMIALEDDWVIKVADTHYDERHFVETMTRIKDDMTYEYWHEMFARLLFTMVRADRFRCSVRALLPKDQEMYLTVCSAILMDKNLQKFVRECYDAFLNEYFEQYFDDMGDYSTLAQIISHVVNDDLSVYSCKF